MVKIGLCWSSQHTVSRQLVVNVFFLQCQEWEASFMFLISFFGTIPANLLPCHKKASWKQFKAPRVTH